jgi:hypothetical protein
MRILIAYVRSPAGPARCRSVHMRLPSTSWTCSESVSHCPSLMHHLLWDTHPMFTYSDVHLYGSRDIGLALEPICEVDTPQGGGTCRRQPDASRPDILLFFSGSQKGTWSQTVADTPAYSFPAAALSIGVWYSMALVVYILSSAGH